MRRSVGGADLPVRNRPPGRRLGLGDREVARGPGGPPHSERGHAVLELAVCAGVMIACLAATFQFGYTFYVYNQLVTAVGDGGRYAAVRAYRGAGGDDRAIRNMVVYGDPQPAADATPAVAHLTPEQVDVRWVKDPSGAPTAVDVSIRSFTVNAVFKTFTFAGRPAVEFPFVGRYAP